MIASRRGTLFACSEYFDIGATGWNVREVRDSVEAGPFLQVGRNRGYIPSWSTHDHNVFGVSDQDRIEIYNPLEGVGQKDHGRARRRNAAVIVKFVLWGSYPGEQLPGPFIYLSR